MSETSYMINDLLGFAGAVIWAGVIIILFAGVVGKVWADIWFQKERLSYQNEIEEYKAFIAEYIGMLRNTTESNSISYISQSQFNRESGLYQNLSEAGLELLEAVTWLFPRFDELPRDEDGRKKLLEKRYDEAVKKYNNFMRQLGKAAPFINKQIYYLFDRLRREAHHQILFFPDVRIRKDGDIIKLKSTECYANTDIMTEHYHETMENLRNYLEIQKIAD